MASKEATLWLKIKETGADVLDKIGSGLSGIGKLGQAAFTLLAGVVTKAVYEFAQQEAAVNKLSQAMVQQGMYTTELRKEYEEMAKVLEANSTFSGDQVIAAQAAMQQQLGQIKITQELTNAVADYAAATGKSLPDAAESVARSVATSKNSLKAHGIELNDNMTKQEKLAAAISGLNGKFGGQAKAATEGLGGIKVLGNMINNLFEDLGERIQPVVNTIVSMIQKLGTEGTLAQDAIEGIAQAFFFVTKSIIATIGVGNMVIDVIGGGLTYLTQAISQLLSGNFKQAGTTIANGYNDIKEKVIRTTEETAAKLDAIDQAALSKKVENLKKEADLVKASEQNKSAVAEAEREEASIKALNKKIAEQEASLKMDEAQYALELAQKQTSESEKTAAVIAAEQQRLDAQIAFAKMRLDQATTDGEKEAALKAIQTANDQKALLAKRKFESDQDKLYIQNRGDTLQTIAGMQSSGNKTLAAIGKAAALAQIAISAGPAIAKAWELGPILGPPAAIAVGAALAAQAANVAGVQLAEGGIVMPRPGGTQATIGEAGQAEAVIPLDRAGEFGFGGGTTINLTINGGLLGDASSAYELAKALDVQLLKLRQNNESQSFSGVV